MAKLDKKTLENLMDNLEGAFKKFLDTSGVATKDDMKALEKRIAAVERKVATKKKPAKKSSAKKKTTSKRKPAKKSSAKKKTTARKKPAKKSSSKK